MQENEWFMIVSHTSIYCWIYYPVQDLLVEGGKGCDEVVNNNDGMVLDEHSL